MQSGVKFENDKLLPNEIIIRRQANIKWGKERACSTEARHRQSTIKAENIISLLIASVRKITAALQDTVFEANVLIPSRKL